MDILGSSMSQVPIVRYVFDRYRVASGVLYDSEKVVWKTSTHTRLGKEGKNIHSTVKYENVSSDSER